MLRLSAVGRERAERAGFRLGSSIGRWIVRLSPSSDDSRLSATAVPARRPISLAYADEPAARDASRVARAHASLGATAVAILGVGLELPVTRPLLHGMLGILRAELLVAGTTMASLLAFGSPRDPLQLASVAAGLASPMALLALRPLVGPLLAELVLTAVGLGLLWLARSRQRRGELSSPSAILLSVARAAPSSGCAVPHRLTAAG